MLRRAPALVLAAILVVVTPAGAQDVDSARSQREANRAEQARVAAELDVAHAQVSEIRAALDGLDQSLVLQQAKIDSAAQVLAAATQTAAAQQRIVEETGARIDGVRTRVQSSVVDAYTGGVGAPSDDWMGSADLTEATQKRELLQVVRGRFADDLEQLRSLAETEKRASEAARAAVGSAEQARQTLDAEQAELQRQRDTEARLEDGLRAKVGDYEAQAAQLQAAEQELTDVIAAHEREEAAAAAATAGSDEETFAPQSSQRSSAGASASGFIMPADGPITSPFGYRRHPILGTGRLHAGTDVGAPYGAPIWAAKAGEVIFAGWNGGYGNCVIISHGGGISTLYGHQSELNASVGQNVSQGDVIGWVGSTGQSTGAHLHFEVRVSGNPEDPMLYL